MTTASDSQGQAKPRRDAGVDVLADYPQTMNKEVIFRG
jgi:hypothetical protein